MASLPYIQLYVSDYLADTAHLTTEEHGAYLLLIFNYWQRGKPLPNNDKRLAMIARLSNERWTDVKETLSEFFNVTLTEWEHHRIDRDLYSVSGKSNAASIAGKASAEARRLKKQQKTTDVPTDVPTDVQRTFNHTDTDTDTDTDTEQKEKENTANAVLPKPKKIQNDTDKKQNFETAALIALGIDLVLVQDFLKIRKTKLTQTAVDAIAREADKAGIAPSDAVRICIERSWQSFNSGWNWNPQQKSLGDRTSHNQGSLKNNGVNLSHDDFTNKNYGQSTATLPWEH